MAYLRLLSDYIPCCSTNDLLCTYAQPWLGPLQFAQVMFILSGL